MSQILCGEVLGLADDEVDAKGWVASPWALHDSTRCICGHKNVHPSTRPHTSYLTHQTSPITPHRSHLTNHTSASRPHPPDLSHQASSMRPHPPHITHHTSSTRPHPSDLTHETSSIIPDSSVAPFPRHFGYGLHN